MLRPLPFSSRNVFSIATLPKHPMKFSRLIQPRNPLFWLMLSLNILSSFLLFIVQTRSLNTLTGLLVIGFAIGNTVLGLGLAWRLMHSAPEKD